MKKILSLLFLFAFCGLKAQFFAYDPFDDNSNEWFVRDDDSVTANVTGGVLDVNQKLGSFYNDVKGVTIDTAGEFRVEAMAGYVSGKTGVSYGICWGAADLGNFHIFYITADGSFGFSTLHDHKLYDDFHPEQNPIINKNGKNWLRVSVEKDASGQRKMIFCINELIVKTIDLIHPYGTLFGFFVG
ncbi:MAG TPA: hypothetical protein VFU15_15910, partial [Bacteroidia bacterium]|nr:hypothetical protein [Bacteroidia bacterium]